MLRNRTLDRLIEQTQSYQTCRRSCQDRPELWCLQVPTPTVARVKTNKQRANDINTLFCRETTSAYSRATPPSAARAPGPPSTTRSAPPSPAWRQTRTTAACCAAPRSTVMTWHSSSRRSCSSIWRRAPTADPNTTDTLSPRHHSPQHAPVTHTHTLVTLLYYSMVVWITFATALPVPHSSHKRVFLAGKSAFEKKKKIQKIPNFQEFFFSTNNNTHTHNSSFKH